MIHHPCSYFLPLNIASCAPSDLQLAGTYSTAGFVDPSLNDYNVTTYKYTTFTLSYLLILLNGYLVRPAHQRQMLRVADQERKSFLEAFETRCSSNRNPLDTDLLDKDGQQQHDGNTSKSQSENGFDGRYDEYDVLVDEIVELLCDSWHIIDDALTNYFGSELIDLNFLFQLSYIAFVSSQIRFGQMLH